MTSSGVAEESSATKGGDEKEIKDLEEAMSSQVTHVNATEYTIEGWLRKRTSLFTWRKYFFSLSAKRVLTYFSRLDSRHPVGSLRLSRRTRVCLDPKKECGLVVCGEGRAIRLAADSKRDAVLWKEMLCGAVASIDDVPASSTEEKKEANDPGPTKSSPNHARRPSAGRDELSSEDFFYDSQSYTLSRAIGRGSYGLVVSGRDVRTQLPCAIKKIGNAFADLVDAKRIVREIRLMHSLSHPNLLEIYDCYPGPGEDFDEIYIVTELLQTDLHDVIYARRPLSRAHVQFFCYQLLRGLEHMHAANVLHRDVKPGNILLNDKCELKICDFGLARSKVAGGSPSPLTEYVVTRWYRAPELLLSCPTYTGAIDMWSLGCVLAEMIERKPLFGGRDVIDQIRKVVGNVKAIRPRECDRFALQAFVSNQKARTFVLSVQPLDTIRSWGDVVPKLADSKNGIDFLSNLLRFNPSNRPSPTQALQHPFLHSMLQELSGGDVRAGTRAPTRTVDLIDIEKCPLEKSALQSILKQNDLRYTPPSLVVYPTNGPADEGGHGDAKQRRHCKDENVALVAAKTDGIQIDSPTNSTTTTATTTTATIDTSATTTRTVVQPHR